MAKLRTRIPTYPAAISRSAIAGEAGTESASSHSIQQRGLSAGTIPWRPSRPMRASKHVPAER